jgi:hypothetical protein
MKINDVTYSPITHSCSPAIKRRKRIKSYRKAGKTRGAGMRSSVSNAGDAPHRATVDSRTDDASLTRGKQRSSAFRECERVERGYSFDGYR